MSFSSQIVYNQAVSGRYGDAFRINSADNQHLTGTRTDVVNANGTKLGSVTQTSENITVTYEAGPHAGKSATYSLAGNFVAGDKSIGASIKQRSDLYRSSTTHNTFDIDFGYGKHVQVSHTASFTEPASTDVTVTANGEEEFYFHQDESDGTNIADIDPDYSFSKFRFVDAQGIAEDGTLTEINMPVPVRLYNPWSWDGVND